MLFRSLGMLEPAIRVFLEFIRDDPRRGRIMLVDSLGVNDEVAALSGATARDYSNMMRQHLHLLVPAARADEVNLDLLADGMIGLNVLLAARWMQDGFAEPLGKAGGESPVRVGQVAAAELLHLRNEDR